MDYLFRPVAPVSPAAAYIGGKKQLAGQLVDLIERVPHSTYAEPFIGMGGVFLRRRQAPKAEVINDRSGDVATSAALCAVHGYAALPVHQPQ